MSCDYSGWYLERSRQISFHPLLTQEDGLALPLFGVLNGVRRETLQRGVPLSKQREQLRRSGTVGFGLVAEAAKDVFIEAGILKEHPTSAGSQVRNWHTQWCNVHLDPAIKACKKQASKFDVRTREGLLSELYRRYVDDGTAPLSDLMNDLLYGVLLSTKPELWKSVKKEKKANPVSLVADYHVISSKDSDAAINLMFADANGRLRLGKRQVSGALKTLKTERRLWADPLMLDGHRDSGESGSSIFDGFPSETPSPEDAITAVEAVRRGKKLTQIIKTVATERRRAVSASSARAHVLERFSELASEQLTLTALAKEVGMSISSISEAFAAEKDMMALDPRIRAFRETA